MLSCGVCVCLMVNIKLNLGFVVESYYCVYVYKLSSVLLLSI